MAIGHKWSICDYWFSVACGNTATATARRILVDRALCRDPLGICHPCFDLSNKPVGNFYRSCGAVMPWPHLRHRRHCFWYFWCFRNPSSNGNFNVVVRVHHCSGEQLHCRRHSVRLRGLDSSGHLSQCLPRLAADSTLPAAAHSEVLQGVFLRQSLGRCGNRAGVGLRRWPRSQKSAFGRGAISTDGGKSWHAWDDLGRVTSECVGKWGRRHRKSHGERTHCTRQSGFQRKRCSPKDQQCVGQWGRRHRKSHGERTHCTRQSGFQRKCCKPKDQHCWSHWVTWHAQVQGA